MNDKEQIETLVDDGNGKLVRPVESVVTWRHSCGWQGPGSKLKPSVCEGIVYGFECPKCGGDWPFNDDDTDLWEDVEYECEWQASNRVKAQRTNKAKFWCGKCDMALIGQVGKCPHCGNIDNKKRKRGLST